MLLDHRWVKFLLSEHDSSDQRERDFLAERRFVLVAASQPCVKSPGILRYRIVNVGIVDVQPKSVL